MTMEAIRYYKLAHESEGYLASLDHEIQKAIMSELYNESTKGFSKLPAAAEQRESHAAPCRFDVLYNAQTKLPELSRDNSRRDQFSDFSRGGFRSRSFQLYAKELVIWAEESLHDKIQKYLVSQGTGVKECWPVQGASLSFSTGPMNSIGSYAELLRNFFSHRYPNLQAEITIPSQNQDESDSANYCFGILHGYVTEVLDARDVLASGIPIKVPEMAMAFSRGAYCLPPRSSEG